MTKYAAQQASQWKTCLACDATYAGEACGKCTAEAHGWWKTPAAPDRILFAGSSDRQEIRVDGLYYGFTTFTDDAGWVLYQGKFPHARRRGTFCTLGELRDDLASRMSVILPAGKMLRVTDLVKAAA